MLSRSFIHVPRVGLGTERALWAAGARDWDAFDALVAAGRLSGDKMARIAPALADARGALARRDLEYFADRLPRGEHWRLHEDVRDRAGYFDIETTGLSAGTDVITAIGLYDGVSVHTFVRGQNLDAFPAAAARFPLLVSYNGASFDVPFLAATFPGFEPRAHIDLRYPLARMGLRGGLKQIERRVGIQRPAHLADMDGFEAVLLWQRHCRGDARALVTLLEYLREDVVHLRTLADVVARGLPAELGWPHPAPTPAPTPALAARVPIGAGTHGPVPALAR